MLKKIDENPRSAAIFYGVVGSTIASIIWVIAPTIFKWLGNSTLQIIIDFIDKRYSRAASLETINYSFYILTILFVIYAIFLVELVQRLNKIDSGKTLVSTKTSGQQNDYFPKYFRITINILFPLSILWGLFQISGEIIVLNAISDFKQDTRIIRPYIEEKELNVIVSDWSQMRTSKEYNKIYERINSVADKNKLTLNKRKLY